MQIKTNYHWRELLTGAELPEGHYEAKRQELDHLSDEEFIEEQFFCYKGEYLPLSDFLSLQSFPEYIRKDSSLKNWQGIRHDTFWTGLLIRVSEDCEYVQVAWYSEQK